VRPLPDDIRNNNFFLNSMPKYTKMKNKCGKEICKCEYEDTPKSMKKVIEKGNRILRKTIKIPKKKTLKEMFVIRK